MTDLNEMWTRLERHQPFAGARGHGEAWAKVCEERTLEAATAPLPEWVTVVTVAAAAVVVAWAVVIMVELLNNTEKK